MENGTIDVYEFHWALNEKLVGQIIGRTNNVPIPYISYEMTCHCIFATNRLPK